MKTVLSHQPLNAPQSRKRVLLSAILLFILFSVYQPVNAQTLRGSTNNYIGSIDTDGVIRNKNNSQVGRICSDGVIRNSNNSQIGKIESDGVVRNSNNSQIGKVESDGTVRDRNNAQIGSAKGIRREWAAVAFFFFFDLT